MTKIRIVFIVVFTIIIFIFSIALIVGGATQFNRPVLPLNLIQQNCTLSSHRIVVDCKPNGFFGIWDGFILDDVFSIQPTYELAELSIYRPNGTYPCLCTSTKSATSCNPWIANCFLNIESTRYTQMTGNVFKYGSDVMIAIGSLLLILLIIFSITMCKNGKKDQFAYIGEKILNAKVDE